jgi:hypothetical protein
MNGQHYVTATAVCSDTGYRGAVHNTATAVCSDTGYRGAVPNTAAAVCSDTGYREAVHSTGTVMCQSRDIQVLFAVFEQLHLALSTVMWTVLFKHRTAYLNVTWVFLQYECENEKYILWSWTAWIVFVKDSIRGRKLPSWDLRCSTVQLAVNAWSRLIITNTWQSLSIPILTANGKLQCQITSHEQMSALHGTYNSLRC